MKPFKPRPDQTRFHQAEKVKFTGQWPRKEKMMSTAKVQPIKKVLVVAGNFEEFFDRVKRLDPEAMINLSQARALVDEKTEYIYISDPIKLRGWHGVEVQWWGSYAKREDFEEMSRWAAAV